MDAKSREKIIKEEINELEDSLFIYDYIIMKGMRIQALKDNEYEERNLVKGCQAKVWIVLEGTDDDIVIRGDSKSLLVKGLLGILIEILNHLPVKEILDYKMSFLYETAIGNEISSQRKVGLKSMLKHIKKELNKNAELRKEEKEYVIKQRNRY
ncbi:MAG: SufE family protein [Parasporobacterium sp.]|nr:SufE family protein [Parasporobacterium sp.]